jgi:hypothetical protein
MYWRVPISCSRRLSRGCDQGCVSPLTWHGNSFGFRRFYGGLLDLGIKSWKRTDIGLRCYVGAQSMAKLLTWAILQSICRFLCRFLQCLQFDGPNIGRFWNYIALLVRFSPRSFARLIIYQQAAEWLSVAKTQPYRSTDIMIPHSTSSWGYIVVEACPHSRIALTLSSEWPVRQIEPLANQKRHNMDARPVAWNWVHTSCPNSGSGSTAYGIVAELFRWHNNWTCMQLFLDSGVSFATTIRYISWNEQL